MVSCFAFILIIGIYLCKKLISNANFIDNSFNEWKNTNKRAYRLGLTLIFYNWKSVYFWWSRLSEASAFNLNASHENSKKDPLGVSFVIHIIFVLLPISVCCNYAYVKLFRYQ